MYARMHMHAWLRVPAPIGINTFDEEDQIKVEK